MNEIVYMRFTPWIILDIENTYTKSMLKDKYIDHENFWIMFARSRKLIYKQPVGASDQDFHQF